MNGLSALWVTPDRQLIKQVCLMSVSVMKMLGFDRMMFFHYNWGMVVLMMHHVLDLVVRVIDQVAGWLVVQMLMLSWIVSHRFAAVGVNLLVEVRMHLFPIDVVSWVVRLVMKRNAVVVVTVTVVVHWDALNLVVMVLVMVRVRPAHIFRLRVVVGALGDHIVLQWSRHCEVHRLMLFALVVVCVVLVPMRVLRCHVMVCRVLIVVRCVLVTLVVLIRLRVVALVEPARGGFGMLAASVASLVRFLALIVVWFVLVSFDGLVVHDGMLLDHSMVSWHGMVD